MSRAILAWLTVDIRCAISILEAWARGGAAVLVAFDYRSFMRGETPSARALRMVAGRFLRAKMTAE
jgi:hypothetical protein